MQKKQKTRKKEKNDKKYKKKIDNREKTKAKRRQNEKHKPKGKTIECVGGCCASQSIMWCIMECIR